ncbi:hypothetical protein Lal_00047136 [Lupinus albus]|nr:hypothetical protein Lal_00047136 [Lupinus albus]
MVVVAQPRCPFAQQLLLRNRLDRNAAETLSLKKASPRHLAKTIPSSKARHPPWPRSGVAGCKASPTTHTLPLLIFPNMSSHGCLYLNGNDKKASSPVFSMKDLASLGIFSSLFNIDCFSLAGLSSISLPARKVKGMSKCVNVKQK